MDERAGWKMKRRLIDQITEILIHSQFSFFVENEIPLTAENAANRTKRAIEYYQGVTEKPHDFANYKQTGFHTLINHQIHHIEHVLREQKDHTITSLEWMIKQLQ